MIAEAGHRPPRPVQQQYYSVNDVATYAGVCPRTVWARIAQFRRSRGRQGLRAFQLSPRQVRIRLTDLEQFIADRQTDKVCA